MKKFLGSIKKKTLRVLEIMMYPITVPIAIFALVWVERAKEKGRERNNPPRKENLPNE